MPMAAKLGCDVTGGTHAGWRQIISHGNYILTYCFGLPLGPGVSNFYNSYILFKALKVLYYLIGFCDDWSHKIAFDSIFG